MTKSPINWYGGKYYMKKTIVELFPKHKTYIEGFGGAGHILLYKEPSEIEVYNDLNEGLYLFFKLLRNDETRDKLIAKIQLTPYSRREFYECRDNWSKQESEIEKARMFYIKTMQSFSGVGTSWSYSKNKSRRGISQAVSKFLGNVDENMLDVVDRLREIQIENLDIIDLLDKYDSKDSLFYLDPPYIAETRISEKVYDKEMPLEKHEELIDKLLNIKGKVVLSGYDNDTYNKLTDNGWKKINIGDYKNRCREDNNGLKTKTKEEYVWINYNLK